MTTVPLMHAAAVIRAALERLLDKPKAHRPFVVIEDASTGAYFVQFAGSDGEELLFDVPRDKAHCHFLRGCDLDVPVQFAIDRLRAMGLSDDTLVSIFEEAGTCDPN